LTQLPYYTDHGERHVEAVAKAAGMLFGRRVSDRKDVSDLDLFLLLSSIAWHDVGNVYGRSGHASAVAAMTDKVKAFFPYPQLQRYVAEISGAHSGNDALSGPRLEEPCSIGGKVYKVYPRALAALVRLSDEISEDHSRVSHSLMNSVPMDKKIFWEYANSISASYADSAHESVVVTIELQTDKVLESFPCTQFEARSGGKRELPLIEYALYRLEKMNDERIYCSPFLGRYASVRRIEAQLTILEGTRRLPDYDGFDVTFSDAGLEQGKYPDVRCADQFFSQYPQWSPQKIEEALSSS
jgi:hypothetical protein